jgi:hypothetical protein
MSFEENCCSNRRRNKNLQASILTSILIISAFITISPLTLLNYNPTFAESSSTSASLPLNISNSNNCQLNSTKGEIQHVIYIQFDNTHFKRDNPNVPSDLEQMPHLLDFINNKGVLYSNHHTSLISHTATNILTSLTGLYGDHMGVPVSNNFMYFKPDGSTSQASSLAYWTDHYMIHPIVRPLQQTLNLTC